MHIEEAFTFCPRCGQKLSSHLGGFPVCKYCGLHFYTNPRPTTTVILFDAHHNILLTKRGIEPSKGLWDLPGGFIVPHETVVESGKREVREELSVEIEIDHIFDAIPDEYEYQGVIYPTLSTIMSAHITSGSLKAKDDVVDFVFLSPSDALKRELAFSSIPAAIKMVTGIK